MNEMDTIKNGGLQRPMEERGEREKNARESNELCLVVNGTLRRRRKIRIADGQTNRERARERERE